MRELPILFSTPMVQAILENRKTMTRRTAGLYIVNECPVDYYLQTLVLHATGLYTFAPADPINNVDLSDQIIECKPRYHVGDHIWVKETFFNAQPFKSSPMFSDGQDYVYKADKDAFIGEHKWKPSLFMPKVAARLWLEVTNVRCERLVDISEQDAIAEGIKFNSLFDQYECPVCREGFHSGINLLCEDGFFPHATDAFAALWHKINGFDSWIKDPWVFIYEFKRIEKP